jgi:hypothetical protein
LVDGTAEAVGVAGDGLHGDPAAGVGRRRVASEVRIEGKEYTMTDGDVAELCSNV